MARSRFRFLHLLTLALFLCPLVHATDFPQISDEDMKFKEVPGQPGAPAAILYREEVDDDFQNHSHMTYVRMKILTEAGRRYADVIAGFEKGWSNIENVSARTIHADGGIVPFDGKVYDKEITKAHGIKIHAKSFTLADVQVGSIIEYRYYFRYYDQYFMAPQWVVQDDLWQKKVHFKYMPADTYSKELMNSHDQIIHGVSWTAFCPKEMQPKLTELPTGQQFVELNGTNVVPFVDEPYMVTSNQFKFNIHFYYVTSNKQEDFWKQEGKWWSKDAEKFMNKKDGLADQVNQLVATSDSPEQKARKIYAFVAGLENQSYVPQRTSQERLALGMKDRGVSDILKQKSGNRDELTRLFVAMARAAGIPAHLMIVTSRENNYFEPSYLSADQLDWEIAIVGLNGKEVFLDPGTKFCPYGLLYWELSATGGLRETDNGTAIAQTPGPEYTQAITQRIGRFVMNDDGTIEGNMKAVFMGQEALTRRQSALLTDAEGRKKELEDEIKSWLPAGAEVKLVQEPAWEATSDQFTATFHVQTTLAASAGKRVLLPLHVFQFNEKPKFPSPERTNGVYLYYPSREVDDVTVTLPAALEVETLPQSENARVDYAMYKSNWTQQQRTISATRDLAMAGFVFAPKEYKDLKGFYDKVKAGDEQQAVLKVSANVAGK
jgi:hypothetical protein